MSVLALAVLAGLVLTGVILATRRPQRLPLALPSRQISLCLVVRDQADRVEGLLLQALALAEQLAPCVRDVVLFDGGSTDGTAQLVRLLGRRFAGLKALCWPDDAPGGLSPLESACAACDCEWVLVGRAATAPGGAAVWRAMPAPPADRSC